MAAELSTGDSTVLVEVADRVAVLTLHRPAVHNALNTTMAAALIAQLAVLAADDTVRAVVLTGAGRRAFCAGADLKQRLGLTTEVWMAQHRIFQATFAALLDFGKPILTAANGITAGGGLELALCSDFIIAASTARFGQPEVKVGIMPGGGAPQLLPRLVGLAMARQLLVTGELIDADRACRIGLVNSVHEPDALLAEAVALARTIAANSPAAVRGALRSVNDSVGLRLPDAIERSLVRYERVVDHADREEGVRAFNEGRPPAFLDAVPESPLWMNEEMR